MVTTISARTVEFAVRCRSRGDLVNGRAQQCQFLLTIHATIFGYNTAAFFACAYHNFASNFGRGVPRTAIAATTSSQNGSTPTPGIASRASPGNSSHCQPSIMNSSRAVPTSITHTIGGAGVAKAPMTSEMPPMRKARASRLFENLRVFEDAVSALGDCLPLLT